MCQSALRFVREHSLWPQRRPAVADDGGLLPAVGVEEQPVGSVALRSERQRRSRSSHVWRQSSHDGVVASEAVAVIVVVHDGDLDGHAIEVDHAVDHGGGLRRCNA